MSQDQIYFAAKPKDELAHDLTQKIEEFGDHLTSSGLKDKWKKSYNLYFGKHFGKSGDTSTEIQRAGENGEIAMFAVNHYRNFLKHQLVMATNQKPAFDTRAINSDLKSLQQAKLANNILDAYLREKRLARYLKSAAEHALVFGKGFVKAVWEPSLGRPHAVESREGEDGQPVERVVYEGDVDVSNPSPYDVYCDQTVEDWNRVEWVTIRSFRNKFNLAARYPEMKDKILGLRTKEEGESSNYDSFGNIDETSDVPVYEFYHKRTDALPNGRYVLFCNGDTVLYDGPIPYKRLPIFRIVPGEVFGTTEGYSDGFDLMGIQEAMNVLVSSIFSNQNAFAMQNVLVPEGCNLSSTQLSQSLSILKYNPTAGKPEALQLTNTPAEVFKFLEVLERTGETISGVNSVARGNPEASLKSGVALSLVQSMAVQYSSGFQQSWAELLEDVGSFLLELLKTFAKTERMVAMAGKHNRGHMAEFKGSDLENVDRVIVELGNPMARTTAGRVQIADTLLDKGLIKTPQEYLTVMNSGNLDPLTEGPEAELALIRKEGEELMEGRPVQALVLDAHVLHMQEHKALLANPLVRRDAAAVGMILAHIQEHKQLYQTQDPLFSMIAGEPPAPQPAQPPMPQGPAPGGPMPGPQGPEQGAPMPAPQGPAGPMPPMPDAMAQGQMPQ